MELYESALHELSSMEEKINSPFSLLAKIAKVHSLNDAMGRELIIRAHEKREKFSGYEALLDHLLRASGLFPYIDGNSLNNRDLIAYNFNKPSETSEIVFHREQAEVFRALMRGENVVLSAPTSFGKSLIIDKLIESGRFNNLLIIVPTIALIDELRKKGLKHSGFKLITHNDQKRGEKNLFILTQERAVDRLDIDQLDLLVIDEFYKLDPSAEEGMRSSSLNIALYKYGKITKQLYLLGPNINDIPKELGENFNCRFHRTDFNTVASELIQLPIEESRETAFIKLCKTLIEPTLIYCKSPKQANEVIRLLCDNLSDEGDNKDIAQWVSNSFSEDWSVVSAYEKGFALHHGQVPRSLGQLNVKLFNEGRIRFLVCTSSLIEGVNTVAKNVVIYESKLARNKLEYFTFKNIQGRAGRMFEHFVGRLYVFDPPPEKTLDSVDIPAVTIGDSASDSLLIQMDDEDVNDYVSNRLQYLHEQVYLPLDVIKKIPGIAPEKLLDLAKDIIENAIEYSSKLSWSNPKYDQLVFCCELAIKHFGGRTNLIKSGKQLAFWLGRLMKHKANPSYYKDVIEKRQKDQSIDSAIEGSFDFQRNWANFTIPKWFMAIDAVHRHIFEKLKLKPGNYASYVARVESLFEAPELVGLDEYGLPLPIGKKLSKLIMLNEGMDSAIASLKQLPLPCHLLSDFENDVLSDVIENLA